MAQRGYKQPGARLGPRDNYDAAYMGWCGARNRRELHRAQAEEAKAMGYGKSMRISNRHIKLAERSTGRIPTKLGRAYYNAAVNHDDNYYGY